MHGATHLRTFFHNINNIQPLNKNISQLIKYNKGPSWSSKECICFVQHIISKHIVLVKDQHNHISHPKCHQ